MLRLVFDTAALHRTATRASVLECGGSPPLFPARYPTCHSVHWLRGRGVWVLGRSATAGSRGPINSANIRCCCFNWTMTSGDGGDDFSAKAGDLSRIEKFSTRMKTQTAAKPAHAFGCGQSRVDS